MQRGRRTNKRQEKQQPCALISSYPLKQYLRGGFQKCNAKKTTMNKLKLFKKQKTHQVSEDGRRLEDGWEDQIKAYFFFFSDTKLAAILVGRLGADLLVPNL